MGTLVPLFLIVSCTTTDYKLPEFPKESNRKFEVISEELNVRLVYDLWEYGSCLLVPVTEGGKNLHIYDKHTGKRIWEGVNEGRGPGETIGGVLNTSFRDGILTYYDEFKESILEIDIDSVFKGRYAFSERTFHNPKWTRYKIGFDDKMLILRNPGFKSPDRDSVKRFMLCDNDGNTLDELDYYPIDLFHERFTLYKIPHISFCEDVHKLVIGTLQGCILEIYDVDTEIRHNVTKYFIKPEMDFDGNTHNYTDRTVFGFSDIYATKDRIFAVYDGMNNDQYRPLFTKIAIFDWNGNPLELIHTDYSIGRICWSEQENCLYAAVSDADGIIYLAKLPLQ